LLNFVLGNLIGISEIDVQSVELLPGASSALYGANAFNGILFMNRKAHSQARELLLMQNLVRQAGIKRLCRLWN
jgi:hypothetical protein